MASSDHQQTAQLEADDEQWVLLQHDIDAVKEELLEEQDDDARGGKETIPNVVEGQLSAYDMENLLWWCRSGSHDTSGVKVIIHNAAERLDSVQGMERILWWCRSAWYDAFVRNALWEDMRLYVFITALSVYMVLHVLAALASLMVFQEARREENFEWFLQMLADMARVHVLTAAIALCASLLLLMWTDVKVPLRACSLHSMVMVDYRELAASRSLKGQADQKSSPSLMIVMIAVMGVFGVGIITFIVFLSSSLQGVDKENAARAATMTSRKQDTALAL